MTLQHKDGKNFIAQMTPGWTLSTNGMVDADPITAAPPQIVSAARKSWTAVSWNIGTRF